jgi:hypothetical protein
MPTKNARLNVVLEPVLKSAVGDLARRDGVSLSLKARDLIKEALELHEDACWAKAAEERDKTFSRRKALSHHEVWK